MAYQFKELEPGTYQVEDHTIIKDGNGNWVANPPIEKPSLHRAFLNYTKNLK